MVFDVGDTLVAFPVGSWEEVDRLSARALVEAARRLLRPAPEVGEFLEVFRRVVEQAHREATPRLEEVQARRCLEQALAELGYRHLAPEVVDRLERAWCGPRLAVRRVFDDVHPVLSRLRAAGIRLGLISNIWLSGPIVREHLHMLGLAGYFDSVVLSSEVGRIKPHPELFLRSLQELQVSPAQALYVGDNPHADVAGAAAVGMRAILLRRPAYPGQVAAPEAPYHGPAPERVIHSLEPLLAIARVDPGSGDP